MIKAFKKIATFALTASLVAVFSFGAHIGYAQVNSSVGGQNLFRLLNGAIIPVNSSFTIGNSSNRVDVYADTLDATTLTVSAFSAAGLDLGGGDLTNGGIITGTNFVATSTTATSTFAGGIAVETTGFVYDYSTNRVGIGTASPTAPLSVVGNTALTGNLTVSGSATLGSWLSSNGGTTLVLTDDGSDTFLTSNVGGTNSFTLETSGAFFRLVANPGPSNGYLLASITETQGSDTQLNFYEGGTGHNRFWDSGSLRIGGSEGYLCSNLTTAVDCDTSGTGADLLVQDDIWFGGALIGTSTDSSYLLGKLGIGTTTPTATLTAYGDAFLEGASRYLSFGTVQGTSGHGVRDNAGTMEYKDDGGSWTAFSAGGGGNLASTTVQSFTASGTWTKPAGLVYAIVEVQGAGGDGAAGSSTGGGGGGSGGYTKGLFVAAELGATETVTVGTAGIGSGSTTFGSLLTGGNGGDASTVTGGTAGSASGGFLNIAGQAGQSVNGGGAYNGGGDGGSSIWGLRGGGGRWYQSGTGCNNGQGAGGYGAGGGGGGTANDGSPGCSAGGGSAGIIIVHEYY